MEHKTLSHFDDSGASRMVDVTEKGITNRTAVASGKIRMQPETLKLIQDRRLAKGNVFEVARIAAIMATKRTADLIPLCHPLALTGVAVSIAALDENTVQVRAECRLNGKTGVEMEALTAVSVGCLTIYDMCKAVDRGMVIEKIQLEEKAGGASGEYKRSKS